MSIGSATAIENMKLEVTRAAVLTRVNRKLARSNQTLRTYRSCPNGIPPFYHFDKHRNVTIAEHVDLEQFARDLGVLAEHEVMVRSRMLRDTTSPALAPRASARPTCIRPFRLRIFPPADDE